MCVIVYHGVYWGPRPAESLCSPPKVDTSMKLTLQFECDKPIERDTEREITAKGRTAEDLDLVISRWKQAYENMTGAPPRAILQTPIPKPSIAPSDIEAIDDVDYKH